MKKHTLNPEVTILYQIYAQKAQFKVLKICNINFWIENAPPPLWNFSENSSDFAQQPFPREGFKTLPKALRTQALTALTNNFGQVGLVK